jgi:L-fuculose-phosphate aldolase
VIDVLRSVVAAAYRSLRDAGLVTQAQGGVSIADHASGVLVVTGQGLVASEATADGVAVVDLQTGTHQFGPAPTNNIVVHVALARAGHGAVVHSYAPHATAVGLVRDAVPLLLAQQAIHVGAAVPVIAYQRPGSDASAASLVATLSPTCRACVIRNDGLFSVGPDVTGALAASFAAEQAAQSLLLASTLGTPVSLPADEPAALRRPRGA